MLGLDNELGLLDAARLHFDASIPEPTNLVEALVELHRSWYWMAARQSQPETSCTRTATPPMAAAIARPRRGDSFPASTYCATPSPLPCNGWEAFRAIQNSARALACQGLITDRFNQAVYDRLVRPAADVLGPSTLGTGWTRTPRTERLRDSAPGRCTSCGRRPNVPGRLPAVKHQRTRPPARSAERIAGRQHLRRRARAPWIHYCVVQNGRWWDGTEDRSG